MTVDPKRLLRDVRTLKKARPRSKGSGTTEAVRSALPTIYRLRAEGALWREIAQALGKQGIMQGQGAKQVPITTNRLTALVRQIEKQQRAKDIGRESTRDVKVRPARQSRPRLAPELTQKKVAADKPVLTEQEVRQAEFEKHAHLLKKR
jgi:hypothetical protein